MSKQWTHPYVNRQKFINMRRKQINSKEWENSFVQDFFKLPKHKLQKEIARMKEEINFLHENRVEYCKYRNKPYGSLDYLISVDTWKISDVIRIFWREIEKEEWLSDFLSESRHA